MRKYLILIIYGIVCVLPTYAFDLLVAYRNALDYNADFLTQVAKTQAGEELSKQAKAVLFPQIGAMASYAEYSINGSGLSVLFNQPQVGAQLQQVVFDFNKFSQKTKADFAVQASELQLENAKQQLIINVAKSYFDILYAMDNLNAIRMNKEAFQKQLEQAQLSLEAGTVTIVDVNDAKASYDDAVAKELQAENDLINKKNIFKNFTGLNPELVQPLVDKINLVEQDPSTIDKWAKMAKEANINIKIAALQVNMATQDIKIAKSGHMPIVSLVGSYLFQGYPNINQTNTAQTAALVPILINIPGLPLSNYANSNIMLQVSIPILSGGRITSQVRQAISNYEAAQAQLRAAERQADREVRDAFYQVQNGISLVNAQTQALKSAKLKLNSDQVSYKVGIRTSVKLIDSQKNYAQAILNYNKARYQYLSNQLQLEYLAGKINEDFLKLVNSNITQ